MPYRRESHAAKATAAGADVCFEDRLHTCTETKIGVSDDAMSHAALAIAAARAHGSGPIKKLRFTDWSQFRNRVMGIHRIAFHADGGANVVTCRNVGEHVLQKVPVSEVIPEMVMRVDDREFRLNDVLWLHRQPVRSN